MPIYCYVCNNCGILEIEQKMTEDIIKSCPQCNSENFRKKLNIAGIQFKGSGFYTTDSKGK